MMEWIWPVCGGKVSFQAAETAADDFNEEARLHLLFLSPPCFLSLSLSRSLFANECTKTPPESWAFLSHPTSV